MCLYTELHRFRPSCHQFQAFSPSSQGVVNITSDVTRAKTLSCAEAFCPYRQEAHGPSILNAAAPRSDAQSVLGSAHSCHCTW